jgi:hypothetical protein
MSDPKIPVAETMAIRVEELLKDNTPIVDAIVNRKVQTERTKREDILFDALNKREELLRNLQKINRADVVTYGEENEEPISQSFSKQRKDDIKKAKENLKKMDEALLNAVNNSTYDPLIKLIKSGGGDQKQQ